MKMTSQALRERQGRELRQSLIAVSSLALGYTAFIVGMLRLLGA